MEGPERFEGMEMLWFGIWRKYYDMFIISKKLFFSNDVTKSGRITRSVFNRCFPWCAQIWSNLLKNLFFWNNEQDSCSSSSWWWYFVGAKTWLSSDRIKKFQKMDPPHKWPFPTHYWISFSFQLIFGMVWNFSPL